MRVSIIIVTYNTKELLEKCLKGLFRDGSPHGDLEVIIVDNASTDGTREWLRHSLDISTYRNIKILLNQENLGFAKAVNQGIAESHGEYILLLNTDALITHEQIAALVRTAASNDAYGVVAPRLVYPDGHPQPSYGHTPSLRGSLLYLLRLEKIVPWGTVIHPRRGGENNTAPLLFPDWISGACVLIKRSAMKRIGTFDEQYFFGVEDMDFCTRARRAGYAVVVDTRIVVSHILHATMRKGKKYVPLVWRANKDLVYFYKKFYPTHILRQRIFALLVWLQGWMRAVSRS